MNISITDPISQAYTRAVRMTFKPFSIGKWFVLGFVAWLATLGDGSGSNFNTNSWSRRAPVRAPTTTGTTTAPTAADLSREVWNWITSHVAAAVLIGAVILVVMLVITLLILWVSCRGKFMFLRAIATNTAEVVAPWKQFHELGNSLFGFLACLMVAALLVNLIILTVTLLIAWPDIRARQFENHALIAVLVGILLFFPTFVILGLVHWCTVSFVATIMYARGSTVTAAWQEFRENVVRGNVGKIVLFLLMDIVLGLGALVGRLVIGCATCCIGFLPYLSTVAALPLVIFMRCYSIYFLQQFGPQYVIIQEDPPAPTGGFPVIGMTYPSNYPPPPPQ